MRHAGRWLFYVWIIIALGWIGFIVGTRFRIGDAYATGFSLLDLAIVAGPPVALLVIGAIIFLLASALFRARS